jgi:hypothetical protein
MNCHLTPLTSAALDRILTDFRANKLTVPISCEHITGDGTKARCDEIKILRSMTLNDLRSIEAVSESEVNNGMRRVDRLGLAGAPPSSHHSILELLVESEQRYGKQSASRRCEVHQPRHRGNLMQS